VFRSCDSYEMSAPLFMRSCQLCRPTRARHFVRSPTTSAEEKACVQEVMFPSLSLSIRCKQIMLISPQTCAHVDTSLRSKCWFEVTAFGIKPDNPCHCGSLTLVAQPVSSALLEPADCMASAVVCPHRRPRRVPRSAHQLIPPGGAANKRGDRPPDPTPI
jgi:hypothetical protein